MRILFSLSHAGQFWNAEWVLRHLGERGHEVTVLLHREEPGGAGRRRLDALAREAPWLHIEEAPRRRLRSRVAVGLRLAVDYERYLDPAYSEASFLRARARRAAPGPLRLVVDVARLLGRRAALRRLLRAGERRATDTRRLEAVLRAQRSALAVATPLVDLGAPQVEVIRAAAALGIPAAVLVASWDNLTTKGTFHELPERILVWNERQRDEAIELHGVPAERLAIVGAAPWEHWLADGSHTRERSAFCAAAGLDPDAPYVLYLGSSGSLAPGEGAFVEEWLESVGADAPQVLVRPHPLNPLTAEERARLEARAHVRLDLSTAGAERSRGRYAEAVLHAGAVVGLNTSGLLEAALAGRPALVPTCERYRATQWGTLHFRDILAAADSPLEIAPLGPEHRAQLVRALAEPEAGAERRRAFVEAFVRPAGAGPLPAERVVDALEELA